MKPGLPLALLAGFLFLPAAASADTLVDNIDGMRFERDGTSERFAAMLIDDEGRVARLYRRGERLPKDPDYRVDGRGRVLLPGFVDAHVNLLELGLSSLTLDLSDTTSLAEAQARIAAHAARHPNRPWIIGRGWNQEDWGLGRFPTAAELDAAVPGRPVWMARIDGQSGWANSAALAAAGIGPATDAPPGGRIDRLPGSDQPSGMLVGTATGLIEAKLPPLRPADRDRALQEAQALLLANGITAATDMGTTLLDWQSIRRAGDHGRLRMRIIAFAEGIDEMITIAGPEPSPWLYDDRLRLAGVRLVLDGALGSRAAWLVSAYADAPGETGLPIPSGTQLRNLMSRAAMDGFQIAINAVGDAANREALDAMTELADSFAGERRWRIEHAQVLDPADIARFGALGVIASMQPPSADWRLAEARLGPDRMAGADAWQAIAASGAQLAFGTNAPVEAPDVLAGLAAAIGRRDTEQQPFGGLPQPGAVSRGVALAAYGAGAAYAGGAEQRFGSLQKGEWADFILISVDPLAASPEQIRRARVLETWVAGRRVHEAGNIAD